MTPPRVLGLGQCSLDYLVLSDDFPLPDRKIDCRDLTITDGGPVATALVALQRWGRDCAFLGVVGDDDFGREIQRSLGAEGIDLSGLQVRSGAGSQFAFIVVEPERGRRTVFCRRPTGAPLAPAEIPWSKLEDCDLFYTDGVYPEVAVEMAERARSAGAKVVVDAGTLRPGMLELAKQADCFVVSEAFSESWQGPGAEETTCRELAALGVELAGVTLGPRGYRAHCQGALLGGKAHPVEVFDTTGCGDIFHAGLAHGLLAGWSPRKTLDFAAWAAAQVATQLGGRAGIPSAEGYPG